MNFRGNGTSTATLRENQVVTRLIGTLSFQWRDGAARLQPRERPVSVELRLFEFDTAEGAEMGAPGAAEGGFRTVTPQLDRNEYRLSLPYHPRLAPGQNQRFELALDAPKASRHLWELNDGSQVATASLNPSCFVPQMALEEARQFPECP